MIPETRLKYRRGGKVSKTVRLEDDVYARLEAIRLKRETFSETVSRCLTLLERLGDLMNTVEGQKAHAEWQKRELQGLKTFDPGGDSPEVPHVP